VRSASTVRQPLRFFLDQRRSGIKPANVRQWFILALVACVLSCKSRSDCRPADISCSFLPALLYSKIYAPRAVYLATSTPAVYVYRIGIGGLLTLSQTIAVPGTPGPMATDGRTLFLAHQTASGPVSAFSIDQSNGSLTYLFSQTVSVALPPQGIAVDPAGTLVFLVTSSPEIFALRFNGSGFSTVAASISLGGGGTPVNLRLNPSGTFLYTSNQATNNASVFQIHSSGVPSLAGNTPVGGVPHEMVFSSDGSRLYVTHQTASRFTMLLPGADGLLAAAGGSFPVTTSTTPDAITTDAGNRFLYVGHNAALGPISGFTMDASGAVTPVPGNPVSLPAGGIAANLLRIDASGQYLYAVSSAEMLLYGVNQSTGGLAQNQSLAYSGVPASLVVFAPYQY
jgi:6-phosphogluconolactonase (cycloisomerase 2 family)